MFSFCERAIARLLGKVRWALKVKKTWASRGNLGVHVCSPRKEWNAEAFFFFFPDRKLSITLFIVTVVSTLTILPLAIWNVITEGILNDITDIYSKSHIFQITSVLYYANSIVFYCLRSFGMLFWALLHGYNVQKNILVQMWNSNFLVSCKSTLLF